VSAEALARVLGNWHLSPLGFMGGYFLSEILKSSRMNLDSDGMDDISSQESPLGMEGNYKKVRGRTLLFINN
jgi:hypothetical protein